jgi:cobalt-precorrin 5A hydrolase/cobalt-precorrin 5A hydrolase/precorrin-3B C17-methyltransferase
VSAPGNARLVAAGDPRRAVDRVARLVVGAGCSRGCPPEELAALVESALAGLGGRVVAVATIDQRVDEPCVVALAAARGVPVRAHPAAALAEVPVPTPSAVVARHVGTASVAEAAALLAAGPGSRLAVAKRRSEHATCAIAEEAAWPG